MKVLLDNKKNKEQLQDYLNRKNFMLCYDIAEIFNKKLGYESVLVGGNKNGVVSLDLKNVRIKGRFRAKLISLLISSKSSKINHRL